MSTFELVLSLLLGGVGLALAAPRLGLPWPVLLAIAGTALAFVPGMPAITLDPKLALALFVAPALMDASFDASPRDLRDNWRPVSGLVLILVGITVAAVALTAHLLMPQLPWQAGVALGAIVAPPDAAAAAAVLGTMALPHRIKTILEGESLLNDAAALLIYRYAISAAAGAMTLWTAPLAVVSILGGLAMGFVVAHAFLAIMRRVEDGAPAVLLQFLGTFGVWILADALKLSAVLTMVTYGMTIARHAPGRTSPRHRRASYAVWDVAIFVLNVLAFILVGLQLRAILHHLDGRATGTLSFAAAILAAVILVRIAWVMSFNAAVRWKNRRFGATTARPMMLPSAAGGVLISWCGMRGMVTLAAALALPEGFAQRDLIIFSAFGVVLGTLVLQGLTLRPLIALLPLPQDDRIADEAAFARQKTAKAALDSLGEDRNGAAGRMLAKQYEVRLGQRDTSDPAITGLLDLRRRALAAEREHLIHLRREGQIGDDAFHRLEEELDWAEADQRNA